MNEYQAAMLGLVITILALVLTVVALLMARSQTIDLRKLKLSATEHQGQLQRLGASLDDSEEKVKALADLTKDISGSLSTKAIGAYPTYVDEITALLNRACEKASRPEEKPRITIVCDVPCYCMFSGPQQWQGYRSALQRALLTRERRSLRIIWMNAGRRKQLLKEQFKPAHNGDASRWKTDLVRKKLTDFLELYAHDKAVNLITYEEFEAIVEDQHVAMIRSMQAAQPREHKDRLHLMFWVADDEEAIFAIPNFTERGRGLAFYTKDPKIIGGLLSIYDRLEEEAEAPLTATA